MYCVLKNIYASTMWLNMVLLKFFQNIDKIPLVKCPVLVIHVSIRILYPVVLNYTAYFLVFLHFLIGVWSTANVISCNYNSPRQ
jgi:hypothetical protein